MSVSAALIAACRSSVSSRSSWRVVTAHGLSHSGSAIGAGAWMPWESSSSTRWVRSCVRGAAICESARTALIDFSTACWAWKPIASSCGSVSAATSRATARSLPRPSAGAGARGRDAQVWTSRRPSRSARSTIVPGTAARRLAFASSMTMTSIGTPSPRSSLRRRTASEIGLETVGSITSTS